MSHIYRLDLSYRGTEYCGWQKQNSQKTVQGELEKALAIVTREPVKTLASSRTDSGVHALHQVVRISVSFALNIDKVLVQLNALLPNDICVKSIRNMPSSFHPIRDSRCKLYRYQIRFAKTRSVFLQDYEWHIPGRVLNVEAMQRAAKYFVGTHDFVAFCGSKSGAATTIREVLDVRVRLTGGSCLVVEVLGKGFLKQMVRNIVGTLVDVALEKKPIESIRVLLEKKNRLECGQAAPARGLTLVKVWTFENHDLPVNAIKSIPV